MGLSESLEQISFGKSHPKLGSCLGLYLAQDCMFLGEVQLSGKAPAVSRLLRLPFPPAPGGAADTPAGSAAVAAKTSKTSGILGSDLLADPARLGGILQKALAGASWKTRNVVVSLSSHFAILRYFTLPAIERRFWKTAVPAEAKRHIPLPFDSLVQDFQVFPLDSRGAKPRLGALFSVTERKNAAGIAAMVQKAGLNLLGVEPAACSVERLWNTLGGPGSYAQVHFDGGDARVLLSEAGMPIFLREVSLGPQPSVSDRRKLDLGNCVDFARKNLGFSASAALRLSGQVDGLDGWRAALSQDVGQQAQVMDVDKSLGLKGAQWGSFAAIGGALRHLASTPLRMDLAVAKKVTEEDRRAAVGMLAVAGILSALLIVSGSLNWLRLHYKSKELNEVKKAVDILEEFKGKDAREIEQMIAGMRKKAEGIDSLARIQVPLTSLLAAVPDSIPDQLWVTNLIYESDLFAKTELKRLRKLTISGFAAGQDRAAEQDMIFKFVDQLGRQASIKQAFPSIEHSLNREGAASAETSYTISCASIKK